MNLSTVLQNRQFVRKETTGKQQKKQLGREFGEIDLLYSDLADLVNSAFRLWYLKRFHKLGRLRVLELASQARQDGNNPAKLFSKLIREN